MKSLRTLALVAVAAIAAFSPQAGAADPLVCVWVGASPTCVNKPHIRQIPPCRVNVGYCEPGAGCEVNVGYCAAGGECVVNVGYCDDTDLPVGL